MREFRRSTAVALAFVLAVSITPAIFAAPRLNAGDRIDAGLRIRERLVQVIKDVKKNFTARSAGDLPAPPKP